MPKTEHQALLRTIHDRVQATYTYVYGDLWAFPFPFLSFFQIKPGKMESPSHPDDDAHALGLRGEGKYLQDGVVVDVPGGRPERHGVEVSLD